MALLILSDDLTGAAGVASMLGLPGVATLSLEELERGPAVGFSCVAVNLDTRERGAAEANRRTSRAVRTAGEDLVAARIDSALRGHVAVLVGAVARAARGEKGVLVTDTIPEYGRLTASGRTVLGAQQRDIAQLLAPLLEEGLRVSVVDSETDRDLDALALRCVEEGLTPVDPGPLVARVVRRRLGADGTVPAGRRAPSESVAFVVGTGDPRTVEQIRYLGDLGFPVQKPRVKRAEEVDVFSFSIGREKDLVTGAFLEQLRAYDALVLSGGATANHVLERAGTRRLLNDGQVQPLVSSGVVSGGVLDGKRVVLKGGSIGDDKTYKTILDWLRRG
ncbi:MAG: four-carbon acid sugar kinase family protein [Nitrososphaerales archaeon]